MPNGTSLSQLRNREKLGPTICYFNGGKGNSFGKYFGAKKAQKDKINYMS